MRQHRARAPDQPDTPPTTRQLIEAGREVAAKLREPVSLPLIIPLNQAHLDQHPATAPPEPGHILSTHENPQPHTWLRLNTTRTL